MGAIAQLSTSSLEVEPGRGASMTLTVRNTGSVVDRFTFSVVGGAASWATFTPDTLSLFPEASGTVSVLFAPPRQPSVVAGPMPFGVRALSSEDPAGSVVEEGTLNVAPFSDISVELRPRIARGRRSAKADMAVDNRSNCAYRAELGGSDPAAALTVGFNPSVVDVPPGGASFVKLRIRPKQTFWRGPATTKSFRVTLTSAAGEATAPNPHQPETFADGSMLQESLLPSWIFKALAALVALAVLLVVLWFTLLKPQIRQQAKDQVKSQLAAAGVTSGSSAPTGGSGSGSGGGGSTSATTVATSTGGTSSVAAAGVTVNGTSQATGNGTQNVYKVPSGDVLQITDLLVENSAGNTGTISIARSGTTLMQWSLANFRDLDYHWIAPTVFGAGTTMQVKVAGCPASCTPGIYYAGTLVKSG
jgi:hypothetical protein